METPKTGFGEDARELLSQDAVFQDAERIKNEIEEKKADRTPTDRPSKQAKQAQKIEETIHTIAPLLSIANEATAARWPELRYTDQELEVFSVLAGTVLAKHVQLDAGEYEEEIKLSLFVASTGIKKGRALYRRLKDERNDAAEADEDRAAIDQPRPADA